MAIAAFCGSTEPKYEMEMATPVSTTILIYIQKALGADSGDRCYQVPQVMSTGISPHVSLPYGGGDIPYLPDNKALC